MRRQARGQAKLIQGAVVLSQSLASSSGITRGGALAKRWPAGPGIPQFLALPSCFGAARTAAVRSSPRPDGHKGAVGSVNSNGDRP